MVQIENEYGSFACDQTYRTWAKNITENHIQGKAVLFTNDGPDQLPCGKIDGVLATLDFGAGTIAFISTKSFEQLIFDNIFLNIVVNVDGIWNKLRKLQPNGPLVNSEYYPGWLTHWQEKFQRVPTKPIVDALK